MAAPAPTRRKPGRGSVGVGARGTLNQLGAEPSVSVAIVIVILITALVVSAAPRLYHTRSEVALQATLAGRPTAAANLAVAGTDRISASIREPFRLAEEAGEEFLADNVPESVRSLIVDSELVVESFESQMLPFPGDTPLQVPLFLLFRHMSNVDDHVRFSAGRPPQPTERIQLWTGFECPEVAPGDDPFAISEDDLVDIDGDGHIFCELSSIDVFEIAFSEEALDEMGLEVGDRVLLRPEFGDPLLGGFDFPFYEGGIFDPSGPGFFSMIAEVSGSFVPTDPAEPYWFDDPALISASHTVNADFEWYTGTALMSPEDYSRFLGVFPGAQWRYTYRYFLDRDMITLEGAPGLATDLRGLQTEFPPPSSSTSLAPHGVVTGLTGIIEDFIEQRATTFSMLSIVVIGTSVAALALVGLLAAMIAERQRRATVQLRSRGGSSGQLTRSQVGQGLALTVPAAVLAALAASTLIPGEDLLPLVLALAIAAAATLLFVVAGFSPTHRHLGEMQKEGERPTRIHPPRLVAELVVVALAVGAVVLLRRRAGEEARGLDLLAMTAPALIGLAVSLLALRLYLVPMRLAAWIGSRRRGVVAFVGFRRVLQQAPAARLPFTVVLIAVTTGVFAQVVGSSIDRGQLEASFHPIGADYLVQGQSPERPLPAGLDLSAVDGVEATALASLLPGTRLRVDDTFTGEFVDVLAVEVADYEAVVEDKPASPDLSPLHADASRAAPAGSVENPIPAIVSPNWSTSYPANPGLVFQIDRQGGHPVDLEANRPVLVVVEVRDLFPTVPEGRPFVVVSREALAELIGEPPAPTMMLVRAPDSAHDAIESAVTDQSPALTLAALAPAYSRVHDAPLVALADLGLRLGFMVGVGFALVASVVAVILIRERASRDLGYLGTMGLNPGQGMGLTMIELIPPAVIAGVVGGFLGIGVAHLLDPLMPLDLFIGPGLEAALSVGSSRWVVVWVTLAVAATVTMTVPTFGDRHARRRLGELVRLGDE